MWIKETSLRALRPRSGRPFHYVGPQPPTVVVPLDHLAIRCALAPEGPSSAQPARRVAILIPLSDSKSPGTAARPRPREPAPALSPYLHGPADGQPSTLPTASARRARSRARRDQTNPSRPRANRLRVEQPIGTRAPHCGPTSIRPARSGRWRSVVASTLQPFIRPFRVERKAAQLASGSCAVGGGGVQPTSGRSPSAIATSSPGTRRT